MKIGSAARPARWRRVGRALRNQIGYLRCLHSHDRTPRIARLLLAAAIAYALSPIDLIPDFIPVIGHLDDIVIVPLLVWLALRCIPTEVRAACRDPNLGQ